MITVEEQISELHRRIKKLESTQVRVAAGVLSGANTSTQKGDITLPDGTVVLGAPVTGNYIPEAGHSVPVLMTGTAPVIFPPTQPITSAPPAQVTGVTLTAGIGSIIVRWSALTEADVKWNRGYYQVQLDTVNTFNSGNLKSQDSPGTVSVFTELTPATTYYVRVRGVDYVGTTSVGGWSATSSLAAGSPVASTITGQITTTQIADNSISTPKLQANSVTANEIAANAITAADMLANTITAGQIAANTLTSAEINADAITASELAALNLAVGKYIKSTTYVAGSSGWAINADGSAEFSNVVVRGTVDSARIKASTITGVTGSNVVTNPGAETNTTGWTGTNCTLTRDTGVKRTGTGSFKLQASAAGDMSINTPTGTSGFPIVGGVNYTAVAYFKTAVTTRSIEIEFRVYDSGGSLLTSYSDISNDHANVWRSINISTASSVPSNAAFASVHLTVSSAAINEVHNIDDVYLISTSTLIGDFYTGTVGQAGIKIVADVTPQIVFFQGVDAESAAQIYRLTNLNGNNLDGTSFNFYSGALSGGTASWINCDSSGVSSGSTRLIRLNTDRVYWNDAGTDIPAFIHADSVRTVPSTNRSTTSTTFVEPTTDTVRISSFKKRHADSKLMVTISGSGYSSVTGGVIVWGIYDGTNTTEVVKMFYNNSGEHLGFSGTVFVSGLAAGTYNFQGRWHAALSGQINMNNDDAITMTIVEIGAG